METQHSSLLFGSGDGSWRSQGWRGIHNENIVGSFTIEMTPQYQNIQMLLWSRDSDIHMEQTCSHYRVTAVDLKISDGEDVTASFYLYFLVPRQSKSPYTGPLLIQQQ